jgi:hypothetical protein
MAYALVVSKKSGSKKSGSKKSGRKKSGRMKSGRMKKNIRMMALKCFITNFKEYAGKIDVISGGFPVDWTELPFKNCEKKV